RTGDGWFPSYPYFNETKIRADIDEIRRFAMEAGRDPDTIGIQGMAFFRDHRFTPEQGDELPPTTLEGMVELARRWAAMGATHFTLTAPPWAERKDPDSLLKAMAEFATASRE